MPKTRRKHTCSKLDNMCNEVFFETIVVLSLILVNNERSFKQT